jgi:hypothetical protein
MRFQFDREDITLHIAPIRELFGFPESTMRLHSLCYGTSDPPRCPHDGVTPDTAHVTALFRPSFSYGSRCSPVDFTPAAKFLYELMRHTLLPRMGYKKATTHIQLWLLGALVSVTPGFGRQTECEPCTQRPILEWVHLRRRS